MNLDLSKTSGPDYIQVVVLKNYEQELSYISAKLSVLFSRLLEVSSVVPVFKTCVRYFHQILIFHQMKALQEL